MSVVVKQQLETHENRYHIACDQVYFLDDKLDRLFVRYQLACERGKRTSANSLRLQLSVTKNLRNVYYQYALAKADLVNKLRRYLYGNSAADILQETGVQDSEEESETESNNSEEEPETEER